MCFRHSYCILCRPLDRDGKPIPYWLYKLHGLNHEFKCEVCGDITYRYDTHGLTLLSLLAIGLMHTCRSCAMLNRVSFWAFACVSLVDTEALVILRGISLRRDIRIT